jgi:hypothetical protein
VFAQQGKSWKFVGVRAEFALTGKRPGVQGPIDDAFAAPFLCVRGTGRPWNPAVGAWAEASLRRFAYEWARYMRGDLPIKNDSEVTRPTRTKNLILFGDPGSNPGFAKRLKLSCCGAAMKSGSGTERTRERPRAGTHLRQPIARRGNHYLVPNSGYTFHEKEFAAFNYLLFPRLGDWALLRIMPGAETWKPSAAAFPEEVVRAGFFDEQWKKPLAGSQ